MTGTGFDHNGISYKNYRSHYASSLAISKAINYDSIIDRAIHICLEDFQDTAAPSRVNMYPLVDFDSSESGIQLALLYSSNISEYCPYLKVYSLVYNM